MEDGDWRKLEVWGIISFSIGENFTFWDDRDGIFQSMENVFVKELLEVFGNKNG